MAVKASRIIFMGTMKEWTDDLYTDDPKPFSWCSGGISQWIEKSPILTRGISRGRRNEMKHIAKPLPHLYITAEHNNDIEEKAI